MRESQLPNHRRSANGLRLVTVVLCHLRPLHRAGQQIGGVRPMTCKYCHSPNQNEFPSEINIHPPQAVNNLNKPTVWAFPLLVICNDCGFSEFVLSEGELDQLRHNLVHHWGPADSSFGSS